MDNQDYQFEDDLKNIIEAMRVLATVQARQARKNEQIEKTLIEAVEAINKRLDEIEAKVNFKNLN